MNFSAWNPPYGDEQGERRLIARVLTLSLVLHLVTAWFSVGYQSADEQFQILEFLANKLGWAPDGHMPVEFHYKMRPWLQPWIYYCIARFWEFLGVTDSHFWAFTFRCFSGLMGWLSGAAMALCARDWFTGERARRLVLWGSGVLWFLPALHARPSSESLAGSAFTIGICLVTWAHRRKGPDLFFPAFSSAIQAGSSRLSWLWIGAGAFWGLAFESRYQLAFMAAGGWLWVARNSTSPLKQRARELGLILAGFFAVFAAGRAADRWGFGDWTLTPWRYIDWNLVRGEVSKFGQEPWYEVFRCSVMESWPVLGILFALLVVVAWIRHPRHLITWCHLPFFLVHELIQHKEYRFFYPIGFAGPALLALALAAATPGPSGAWLSAELDHWLIGPARGAWRATRQLLGQSLIALNAIALVTLMLIPFSRNVQFHRAVYKELRAHGAGVPGGPGFQGFPDYPLRPGSGPPTSDAGPEFELLTPGRDPFRILGNPIFFYRPSGLVVRPYASADDLVSRVTARSQTAGRRLPVWIFEPSFELPATTASRLPTCAPVFRTLPAWLDSLRGVEWGARLMARVNVFTLYRCEP